MLDISVNPGLLWVHADLDCKVNRPEIFINTEEHDYSKSLFLTVSQVPKCLTGRLETASSWWFGVQYLDAGYGPNSSRDLCFYLIFPFKFATPSSRGLPNSMSASCNPHALPLFALKIVKATTLPHWQS